jgi:hypothetical protein
MYYRHRDVLGDMFSSDLMMIGLVVLLIVVFVAVKMTLFVIRTFAKYSDHTSLWIALAVCGVLLVVGLLLGTQISPFYCILPVCGITLLLMTCCVISLRNRDTFLRERVSLLNSILRQSWWSSEDTPSVETEQEITPIAA